VDVALLAVAFVVVACLAAGPALAKQTNQVTVFWGQNKDEGSLQEACDTRLYTTVIISFYSVFGHGRYWGDLSGHQLRAVGADIKHCQSKGILLLLSIGGPGAAYSLPSPKLALTSPPTCGTPTSAAAPAPDYAARSATRRWTASTSTSTRARPAAARPGPATTTTSWPGACTRTTVATAAGSASR